MRILRFVGKLLISLGFGVLLFVAWMLWGTGFYTGQQQDRLEDEFAAAPDVSPVIQRFKGEEFTGPPKNFTPKPGEPVFRLSIPAIDADHIVVEGVGTEDLKKGPGHYPSCREGFPEPLCTELDAVWPGERGRVIISGHRTTYGQPFFDLDDLERGDKIITVTKWGQFVYRVSDIEIVEPDARDIANPKATNSAEIALTTCNPKYSAAQRLIVFAEMERPA